MELDTVRSWSLPFFSDVPETGLFSAFAAMMCVFANDFKMNRFTFR